MRSLWNKVASSLSGDGSLPVRGDCDCQRQGGRELELDGMVNISESLINVVIGNKPKVLTGLNQKVRGQVQVVLDRLPQMLCHRRRGET